MTFLIASHSTTPTHPNTLRNQWNNNVLPRKVPYDGDDDVGDDATEIQDVISIPEMCVKQIPL